jgi:hypothetical protein
MERTGLRPLLAVLGSTSTSEIDPDRSVDIAESRRSPAETRTLNDGVHRRASVAALAAVRYNTLLGHKYLRQPYVHMRATVNPITSAVIRNPPSSDVTFSGDRSADTASFSLAMTYPDKNAATAFAYCENSVLSLGSIGEIRMPRNVTAGYRRENEDAAQCEGL